MTSLITKMKFKNKSTFLMLLNNLELKRIFPEYNNK